MEENSMKVGCVVSTLNLSCAFRWHSWSWTLWTKALQHLLLSGLPTQYLYCYQYCSAMYTRWEKFPCSSQALRVATLAEPRYNARGEIFFSAVVEDNLWPGYRCWSDNKRRSSGAGIVLQKNEHLTQSCCDCSTLWVLHVFSKFIYGKLMFPIK